MLKKAKAIVDNRNNGEDGRIAFRILKCIIFIVVAIIVIIFCLARLSSDHAVGTYINNNQLSGYDKEKTALGQDVFLEFSDTCIVAFDSNDLHGISVTLDGQTSEKHLYASTEASQVAQSLGIAEITIGDDGSFTFDANYSFELGETVLMTVEYNGSDNDFGSDITTKYFAFVVGESTNSSSSSGTGTIDANTEENSDMTPSVYFNGVTVATFDSKENAISNCERTYVTSYDIMVEPNGVDRVIISTYILSLDDGSYHFNNDETFIYSGTDWSAHIDLSQYVGEVIVVKVRVEGESLESRYFAVQLRESEATEEETAEAD